MEFFYYLFYCILPQREKLRNLSTGSSVRIYESLSIGRALLCIINDRIYCYEKTKVTMPKLLVCVLLAGLLSLQTVTTRVIASTGFTTGGSLKDYKGKTHTIKPRGKAVVYLFLSPECPLCKNYAPVLQAMQRKYPEIQFYGIVSGKTFTREIVAEYAKDYKITFPILMDPDKQAATSLKATVTPEALLIGENGREYYRGLIDDWVTGLGTKRAKATRLYLALAIENLLSGSDLTYSTQPIGCLISNY